MHAIHTPGIRSVLVRWGSLASFGLIASCNGRDTRNVVSSPRCEPIPLQEDSSFRDYVEPDTSISTGVLAIHTRKKIPILVELISRCRQKNNCDLPKVLQDVVPVDRTSPFSAYDRNILLDSWNKLFSYTVVERGFELRSSGPDSALNSTDDIAVRWKPSDTLFILPRGSGYNDLQ